MYSKTTKFCSLALTLALALPALDATPADAAITKLKAIDSTAQHVWKLARRVAKRRNECGRKIEDGVLPWSVDAPKIPRASWAGPARVT